jgi:lipopolysaccharide biosynthesis regulator YciM
MEMIFYRCDVCGMIINSLYIKCLGCGVESTKTKEEYAKIDEKKSGGRNHRF